MKRVLFSLLLTFAVAAAPLVALAQQGRPFSNTATCVRSNLGFDSNYVPLPGSVLTRSTQSSRGFATDNPDGTVTSTFRVVSVSLDSPPTVSPIGVSEGSNTGPVTINPDGSRLFEYTSTGTVVAGAGAGNTFVTTGGATLTVIAASAPIGFISHPDLPRIETTTVTTPDGMSFTSQQVCTRAGANEAPVLP